MLLSHPFFYNKNIELCIVLLLDNGYSLEFIFNNINKRLKNLYVKFFFNNRNKDKKRILNHVKKDFILIIP